MLFRKNINKLCVYCKHAAKINETSMVCMKKGIVACSAHCCSFRYDPLKRIPEPPVSVELPHLDTEDYSL